jgi:aryl-alcohol dehydrogenase-like predicted oxidoreductase
MSPGITRRQFIAGAVAAGAAALAGPAVESSGRKPKSLTDRVEIGRTGVRASYLGLGTGTVGFNHASNQTRLGSIKFARLINHAYDAGVNFFDCADNYGSHSYLRASLRRIPRDKYVLQTKIWFRTSNDAQADLERFRKELDTDYLDIVLIHCVTDPTWAADLRPMMDVLEEALQKGVIRAHGISIHDLETLRQASGHEWVQTVFARINPEGAVMDGKPAEVVPALETIHASGKGVVGMKILGEGRIAEKREESLRFVLGLECVDAIVIGFESPGQIDEIIKMGNRALA